MSFADEQRHIDELLRVNLRTVRDLPALARRGPHTKHHGCVEARFIVRNDVPPELRVGLFETPGEFQALIRFSNGITADDREGDVHGMAIKVLGVDGPKILENRQEERAQDFVLMDNETFPTGKPPVYVLVNRLQKRQGLLIRFISFARMFLFHRPVLKAVKATRSKKPSSLLEIPYFSTTPYAFGPANVVKYFALPQRHGGNTGVDSADGLGDELAATLGREEMKFDFGVDIQTDEATQPIEDPRISWSQAGAERVKLATIVIPRQKVDRYSPRAENLAFSAWHSLEAHRPLGAINRARRPVYDEMARFRHRQNRIVPVNSSEAPASYDRMPLPPFDKLYWDGPPQKNGPWAKAKRRAGQFLREFAEERPVVIRLVEKVPWLSRKVNAYLVNHYASMTPHRPLPLSLWTPGRAPVRPNNPNTLPSYVTWPGLVDRSFTGRHLPPMDEAKAAELPPIEKVTALFDRNDFKASPRSSALLCFFAQWLSDSFLRTHPDDRRRNTSAHELDLCQIYGLGQESTRKLREGRGGRLKSRMTPVGELPPLLADPASLKVKPEFAGICFDPVQAATFYGNTPPHGSARDLRKMIRKALNANWPVKKDRWLCHYASGLERGGSTILYSALNTLFLREHNRLAGQLQKWYGIGDDDWLFETARNINIVKYLKILIEDYLSHLAKPFKIRVEPGFADRCLWYRTNRISLEFNLLYRWHSMVPDRFWLLDDRLPSGRRFLKHEEFRFNNALIEECGIERILDSASRQPAGQVGMGNTPFFLLPAERNSIAFARQFRLASFNDYRKRWNLEPYKDFMELTGENGALAAKLENVYRDRNGKSDVNRVEFLVGLFAEGRQKNKVLPTLLGRMVASDAFSHALTNPLLAAYVFGQDALTGFGLQELDRVSTLDQIMKDNCREGIDKPLASFDLARPRVA